MASAEAMSTEATAAIWTCGTFEGGMYFRHFSTTSCARPWISGPHPDCWEEVCKNDEPKWSKSDHWSCSLAFSWLTIQTHVQKWHILKIAPCNPRGTRITFCPGCDSDLTWQHSHRGREAMLKVRMHSQHGIYMAKRGRSAGFPYSSKWWVSVM